MVGSLLPPPRLDLDLGSIARGELCVVEDWLPHLLVQALRTDVRLLEASGAFSVSGVSNTLPGKVSQFGQRDRLCCILSDELGGNRRARRAVEGRLQRLKLELQRTLGRGPLHCEERYYSILRRGAFLGKHMDERHEETKGSAAWACETRRSISWLLYLSDPGWDEPGGAGTGGALLAMCRSSVARRLACGSHEENLQVGWLANELGDTPVFLDAWVRSAREGQATAQPCATLYCVGDNGMRNDLTSPFSASSPSWPQMEVMDPASFSAALAEQLPEHLRNRFSSTEEENEHQEARLVSPKGGSLVLFDSVAVPHEVLPVRSGERVALAGWFHEEQQPFPEWYMYDT